MKKVRKLSAAAMMTAVSVILVYLAGIMPTTKLALIGSAGFAGCVIVAESGPVYGLAVYFLSSVLCLILSPSTGIIYMVFFGWYPSLKCVIERINHQRIEWPLKIASFSLAFVLMVFIFPGILSATIPRFASLKVILYGIGVIAFVLYDICLSMMISYYLRVIYPKIRK